MIRYQCNDCMVRWNSEMEETECGLCGSANIEVIE